MGENRAVMSDLFRISLLKIGGDRVYIGPGLSESDSRLKMSECLEHPAGIGAILRISLTQFFLIDDRHEEIRGNEHQGSLKPGRGNPHDGVWMLVELNRSPHYVLIVLKSCVPIRVSQHNR